MKKLYIYPYLLVLILLGSGVQAQEQPTLRDRANQLYNEYQYAKAAQLYERLVDSKKPRQNDLQNLADCYRKMGNYELAENWYVRVLEDSTSNPVNKLRYAEVLKANAKYAEAKKAFQEYAGKADSTNEINLQIEGCDSAIIWMKQPTTHKLRNESAVNTALAEFGGYTVGDKVYYVGEPDAIMFKNIYGWTGNPFLRVYTAKHNEGNILKESNIAEVSFNNEPYHVGPVASNKEGTTLYVTRTHPGKEVQKEKEERKRYRTKNLELYIYTNDNGTWNETPFAYNRVNEYSVGHAALSQDGETLYFVSDMPGGQGGTDIWYSERLLNGEWGEPKNAGPMINSAGDEMFPSVTKEGVLYFSSNGWPGMGNLDVFTAKGGKGDWSKAANMRFPVNSPADDFAYAVSDITNLTEAGFMSSNRKGGVGSDDIYSFTYLKPKFTVLLAGVTYDRETEEPLADAEVSLLDEKGTLLARKTSELAGKFEFEVDVEEAYQVLGEKISYIADSAFTNTNGLNPGDTVKVALYLDQLKQGKTFRLDNIYYDFDKYNIRKDAAVILDGLVKILKDNPTLRIELSSHTDSRGRDKYNMTLSQKRAQAAVDYLVSRGIARDRMIAKGYGESKLLNRCANGVKCSEAEHQLNRRTEFTVLEL
ncbi:OmpA family protein [Olivibacter sp. CPCC 100613]|uniref:OmpA family protein n=1 Tax=Olivibacter sp. CPCC 100613 TaxID=3079931 RepID=UPI002FF94241